MTSFKIRRAVRHALWLGSIAAATAVAADNAGESTLQEVVVTGTRIARPNLESSVPITTVNAEAIFETGNTAVGDLLNDLPALRSTFSQSNSSRFLGTAGLNLLDLRGLGTQRTLVLVNGRRHVGADILNNAVSPDVNTFPSDLIERVDIVTGGSSAVYGSDAIAGVANFILKKNFEGLQFRGQGGTSQYGDANDFYGSALWGTNFMDNRGNVAVNFEVAKQDAFFASQRPNLKKNTAFVTIDTDPAGSPNGADAQPDRTLIYDIRSATIATGGLMQFSPPVTGALAGTIAPCGRDSQTGTFALGTPFRCNYLFLPNGSLVPQTGTRVGLAPNGNFDGGNGTTGREAKTLGIFPKLDRYSLNLIGHLEISEAFDPFVEAKYVRTDSIRYGSPAFFQGTTIDGFYEQPRFDNPFLTASARTTIQAARALVGLAPATASTRMPLFKNLNDLGGRQEEATRETSRIVLGVDGKFGSVWSYEVSANYGEFDEATKVLGNLNVQRFVLAMDSTVDAAGNISCAAKVNPAAGSNSPYDPSNALSVSTLPGDVAACVPLNPFGDGNITPAMKNYLVQDTTSIGKIQQVDINAFISGNTSEWFSLPAGAIGIAAGAEYRTEENFFQADPIVEAGLTFYNALPLFDPPKFEVKEVYSELRFPLLKDLPAAQELSLNVAGRLSDYKGSTGQVVAYNGNLDWAPITDLRFRAGIARAVRAPNLSDLYSQQSQNFAPAPSDPCSARNIGAGPATRAANCAAAGRPALYDYVYTASLEILSGGNPDLKEETSDSVTIGAVWQPSFAPGFQLSVDYYDIDVNDVITAPSAQQIMNACYDSATLNNQFCGLFQRAGAAGGPKGEIPFRILEGSLQQTLLNYAKRTAKGVDIDASYKHGIGGLGTFSSRLVYTHALERNDFLNPADPTREDRILMELGDPQDAANLDLNWAADKWTFNWQIRYISKMVLNLYEDTYSVQGRPPENADYADQRFYDSVFYHDVRFAVDVADKVTLYVGVDNATNQLPPLGLTGTGAGSSIYDIRGRFYYAGAKVKVF